MAPLEHDIAASAVPVAIDLVVAEDFRGDSIRRERIAREMEILVGRGR